jgi:hypothetical protein
MTSCSRKAAWFVAFPHVVHFFFLARGPEATNTSCNMDFYPTCMHDVDAIQYQGTALVSLFLWQQILSPCFFRGIKIFDGHKLFSKPFFQLCYQNSNTMLDNSARSVSSFLALAGDPSDSWPVSIPLGEKAILPSVCNCDTQRVMGHAAICLGAEQIL